MKRITAPAKEKKKYIYDIILVSALILISVLLLIVFMSTRKSGNVAVVEVDGSLFGEYPLSENGVFELNGGTNILVIENGDAYLNYSDCPDHTCEKTGRVRYVGQTIVCLPNKLSVTIKGNGNDSNGVDLVS